MRVAFVVCVWAIVAIVLGALQAFGMQTIIAAPIALLALTIGVFVLRMPEKPRRVFNSANGLLILGGFIGYWMLWVGLTRGNNTMYPSLIVMITLGSIAVVATVASLRFHQMRAVVAGMWVAMLCVWLNIYFKH